MEGTSLGSQDRVVAEPPPHPWLWAPSGEESAPTCICASVLRMGQGQGLPVCGHLQAEGHLEVCQLLPTFQDLGDLALEALFLLLQGLHGQLQSEPEVVSEGEGSFPPGCCSSNFFAS